ncbi:MAG: tyrosine-type recombinase/integrase [Rhizobiales bacterium]|nr:tyrosine-type recombinase/integrase [Hyphomicrobiales bacterium]MBO6699331.1 tyrosine-type recombinase/integrase [Hyphomicrobiales bacterium]MBO6736869.1 tyrosine-type recombinase/integrase [Hyphomicrobiales bacterium]MBO6912057.1 tyrosine-type recombinase/integrase [Hyphomicrobiales bacterium]MBO6954575.1 tyrosine-type recombinase/integrase [Hyphomicrobiales bacterium]
MPKLTKRVVDAAEVREMDYVIWDDELPGFGLRVFKSGKRSYVLQYRAAGRSRRYSIGLHGIWTPDTARKEAKVQLGKIAQGENPAEARQADRNAITVSELAERYIEAMDAGLIMGKGGRPKRPSTIYVNKGQLRGHIIPLIGQRRVQDLTKADVTKMMNDVIAGKTKAVKKTKKRGKSVLRGGRGTASKCVGLTGSMLTYAISMGIIEHNVAHGIRKPKDQVRDRRLSKDEYHKLGRMLKEAEENADLAWTVGITRLLALTGCRRGEVIALKWSEVDFENSCLRLEDSKEGASVRPIGLPAIELLEARRKTATSDFVFPGKRGADTYGGLPRQWRKMFGDSELSDLTAHVLRHSFASIANDLGFTESTIATLLGHATHSITSKYIHSLDSVLIMAADTIAGYINGLLEGNEFKQTAYALDRTSRTQALDRFLAQAERREPNDEAVAI